MPRKAVVVDDDAEIREVLAELLATRGFEVLTAGNGLEALLHVKRQKPEVVSGHLDGEVRR
jgi:CheY-like chemotaxis protein